MVADERPLKVWIIMKKPFQEAAELFHCCETNLSEPTTECERSNFYHALALLAEGLNDLERRFAQIELAAENSKSAFLNGSHRRRVRRIFLARPIS